MGRLFLWMAFLCYCSAAFAQDSPEQFRVVFYNVENLFDTKDNPLKQDEEFLPIGVRHWTPWKYYHKLHQTAKVLTAIGEWSTPALVGLCEVENDSVLIHLLNRTPLRKQYYRFCITSCNDTRGINTALLYQRDKFRLITQRAHPIPFSRKGKTSRDILHVTGQVITQDTMDVFIVHFPSKYGGAKETEQDRREAAEKLFFLADSVRLIRQHPQILLMGDFNDIPSRFSIPTTYTHLFANTEKHQGSHKYQDEWSQLDAMIVCKGLEKRLVPNSPQIFRPNFLLKTDKTRLGKRPFRTYYGYKYEGGFSDHLPIVSDFLFD